MASIKKRGPNSWRVQVRRKGHPPVYRTFDFRADAEIWAREQEYEMDVGRFKLAKLAERTSFRELAERFAEEFAPHHYRSPIWKIKLRQLQEAFDHYALAGITPKVVTDYRDTRLQAPDSRYKSNTKDAPTISPSTVKSELDLLSKMLDVAEKEFCIPLPAGNPVRSVRKPSGSKSRDRRLNAHEFEALLRECGNSTNTWLKPAVELAVATGMRQGEILALKWKNVHFDKKYALLEITKNGESRAVPLSTAAIGVLTALHKKKSSNAVLVFPADRMTLYMGFIRACNRAKIEDFTFHDLRHEALSRIAESGNFSVLEIAAISGHKTLQVLKRYTHFQAEHLAAKLG